MAQKLTVQILRWYFKFGSLKASSIIAKSRTSDVFKF